MYRCEGGVSKQTNRPTLHGIRLQVGSHTSRLLISRNHKLVAAGPTRHQQGTHEHSFSRRGLAKMEPAVMTTGLPLNSEKSKGLRFFFPYCPHFTFSCQFISELLLKLNQGHLTYTFTSVFSFKPRVLVDCCFNFVVLLEAVVYDAVDLYCGIPRNICNNSHFSQHKNTEMRIM